MYEAKEVYIQNVANKSNNLVNRSFFLSKFHRKKDNSGKYLVKIIHF